MMMFSQVETSRVGSIPRRPLPKEGVVASLPKPAPERSRARILATAVTLTIVRLTTWWGSVALLMGAIVWADRSPSRA